MRIRATEQDGVVDVKVLMRHVMETGQRKDAEGKVIPAWFITVVDAKVKDKVVKRKMTVGTFIKKNPEGTFFIIVRGHAFTIKNGVVIGNYEDAIKLRKEIYFAYQIK